MKTLTLESLINLMRGDWIQILRAHSAEWKEASWSFSKLNWSRTFSELVHVLFPSTTIKTDPNNLEYTAVRQTKAPHSTGIRQYTLDTQHLHLRTKNKVCLTVFFYIRYCKRPGSPQSRAFTKPFICRTARPSSVLNPLPKPSVW